MNEIDDDAFERAYARMMHKRNLAALQQEYGTVSRFGLAQPVGYYPDPAPRLPLTADRLAVVVPNPFDEEKP